MSDLQNCYSDEDTFTMPWFSFHPALGEKIMKEHVNKLAASVYFVRLLAHMT